ncbi:MAG: chromate transporter [Actinomycetota bacterium]|nr:chromate transporter [Actinomycetota bacterium]
MSPADPPRVSLATIALEWGRIGVTGFGGPPAHIAALRRLCVERYGWLSAQEFEDGIAATGLLPGPASTQLAIYCAWRLRGPAGALVGALCFIVPGLLVILGLSALFLEARPPLVVLGAAAGAGAAVPAVALQAAAGLLPASRRRAGDSGRWRWGCYLVAGAAAAAAIGPWLVAVVGACGVTEAVRRSDRRPHWSVLALPLGVAAGAGGLLSLSWVAFKVGALSYGGGFVIIPLMQHDTVASYHWMTSSQFLGAVALGQLTPGPVVLTVAVVGYAAAGAAGAVLAAVVAFAPSYGFILLGAPHFAALRASSTVQGFLAGAGPAAVGGIAGAAIPLGLALGHLWQVPVLAVAAAWLLLLRRGVVSALGGAAALGVLAAFAGMPMSR